MDDSINPFSITGYSGPEYFCDREEETRRLISALKNQRNITIISPRKMGKTALIFHVFDQFRKNKNVACFYFDILPTTSLNDFIIMFSKGVLGKMDSSPVRLMKKIGDFFSNLRPVISYDSISGSPTLEFSLENPSRANETMEQIFGYLENYHKRVYIAIDEFQQILNYKEKNTEALLRSNIQRCKNVGFIFSGSHKHSLGSMFHTHGRPFYQSVEIMSLEKINKPEYAAFIKSKFQHAGRKITDQIIDQALEWTESHTWYVQFLFNKIFETGEKNITELLYNETRLRILNEFESMFFSYRNLLTEFQWNLLKAVAKEEQVTRPTSREFISQHHLGTASSVSTALKALVDKELISHENGVYKVYDVFFSRWLARL